MANLYKLALKHKVTEPSTEFFINKKGGDKNGVRNRKKN